AWYPDPYVHVRFSKGAGELSTVAPRRKIESEGARLGVLASHEHYRWWALSCTSLGMLLAATNSGTLIIALPDLERSLHTSLLALVWVILAYLIAATVLVLMAGRLSDLFGRKRAYVGGFLVFALASLGAGFSPDATTLIVWRVVQGIGSAFLFANAAALVTDAFPKEQLGLAVAAVLLPLWVLIERRSRAPMLDLKIFRNRLFAAASAAAFINGLARFALMFLFVFYYQGAQGQSPIAAGIRLTPLALGMLI